MSPGRQRPSPLRPRPQPRLPPGLSTVGLGLCRVCPTLGTLNGRPPPSPGPRPWPRGDGSGRPRPHHLLLHLQEALEVGRAQVVLVVAVGQHEQVEVPARGHHLVEGTELLEAQSALVVVGVCLLQCPRVSLPPGLGRTWSSGRTPLLSRPRTSVHHPRRGLTAAPRDPHSSDFLGSCDADQGLGVTP